VPPATLQWGSSAADQSCLCDEDGIYDPRLVNDRPLLGLKGTFSELELSIFRVRGDLYTTVAIGYRAARMIAWNKTPTCKSVRRCLWAARPVCGSPDAPQRGVAPCVQLGVIGTAPIRCPGMFSPFSGNRDVTFANCLRGKSGMAQGASFFARSEHRFSVPTFDLRAGVARSRGQDWPERGGGQRRRRRRGLEGQCARRPIGPGRGAIFPSAAATPSCPRRDTAS
jgi:hypothetical protein